MTRVNYSSSSPYHKTDQQNIYLEYLDVWRGPFMSGLASDEEYVVQAKYLHRPDLLSQDLYGSPGWWWVFMLRNPNVIKDPIYDMVPGITIFLPAKENLPKV